MFLVVHEQARVRPCTSGQLLARPTPYAGRVFGRGGVVLEYVSLISRYLLRAHSIPARRAIARTDTYLSLANTQSKDAIAHDHEANTSGAVISELSEEELVPLEAGATRIKVPETETAGVN